MRGRVMSLYMLVFMGGNPIGGPMTGWLAAEFGGRSPFVLGGIVAIVCTAVCGVLLARRGGVQVRERIMPRFAFRRRAPEPVAQELEQDAA
jgi:MFS family permease